SWAPSREEYMRKAIVLAAVVAGATTVSAATPSSAAPRASNPSDGKTLVIRAADLGTAARPSRPARIYSGVGSWTDRLGAAGWMSYQITNAGYHAQRYEGEIVYTYFPGDACCHYRRHWPWIGRYHYGYRYWAWRGRYHRAHW